MAATLLEGLTADLLPAGAGLDLIVASRQDTTGHDRLGLIAPVFLRNYGVGDYRLAICR